MFTDTGFKQTVNEPTREASLLDVIAVMGNIDVLSERVVDSGGLSDHSLVTIRTNCTIQPAPVQSFSWRSMKNFNYSRFDDILLTSSLVNAVPTDVDGYAKQIEHTVLAELDKVCPVKHCRRRRRPVPLDACMPANVVAAKGADAVLNVCGTELTIVISKPSTKLSVKLQTHSF